MNNRPFVQPLLINIALAFQLSGIGNPLFIGTLLPESEQTGAEILFNSVTVLSGILGGFVTDRILPLHRSLIIACVLQAIGSCTLVTGASFSYMGLLTIAIGSGWLFAALLSSTAKIYAGKPHRLDGAYALNFLVAAVVPPLIYGWAGAAGYATAILPVLGICSCIPPMFIVVPAAEADAPATPARSRYLVLAGTFLFAVLCLLFMQLSRGQLFAFANEDFATGTGVAKVLTLPLYAVYSEWICLLLFFILWRFVKIGTFTKLLLAAWPVGTISLVVLFLFTVSKTADYTYLTVFLMAFGISKALLLTTVSGVIARSIPQYTATGIAVFWHLQRFGVDVAQRGVGRIDIPAGIGLLIIGTALFMLLLTNRRKEEPLDQPPLKD